MDADFVVRFLVVVLSMSAHEFAHAWAAHSQGDGTPWLNGRLTANPIPHLDLVGSLLLPGFLVWIGSPVLFGWMKPLPLRARTGLVLIAGPLANLALALVFGGLALLVPVFGFVALVNLWLFVGNLLPVPPLDGWYLFRRRVGR